MPGLDQFTKALYHFDDTGQNIINTATGNVATQTNGEYLADQVTTQSKFGGKSLGGSYISTTRGDLAITRGAYSYTVDFWAYGSSNGYCPTITIPNIVTIGYYDNYNNQSYFKARHIRRYATPYTNNTDYVEDTDVRSSNRYTMNTWHHIAFVSDVSTLKNTLYVNGVNVGQSDFSSSSYETLYNTTTFDINLNGGGTSFVDELRVSVGIARWTSDFTPPTDAYGPSAYIGSDNKGSFFKGVMDEVRFSKGASRYSGSFTPPVSPYTRDTSK